MPENNAEQTRVVSRRTIFISKATPEDDEFVLWLGPRLEAAGYRVYADILTLHAGDRWRKELTRALQQRSIKMLLCCSDATLAKSGVQDEIGIAEDVAKELNDPRFIIPLRVSRYKKLLGIGELQYIDFTGSWAQGLRDLLETLASQRVPCEEERKTISPNWESYRTRQAIRIEERTETLTSNWLCVAEIPDAIRYFVPAGALVHPAMQEASRRAPFVSEVHHRGFFAFTAPEEVEEHFASAGKFVVESEQNVIDVIRNGSASPKVRPRGMRNIISSMFRQAWERFCRTQGLSEYAFVNQMCFFPNKDHIPLGKKITWRKQGGLRSSMLRNKSGGRVWQYGISALPALWPYPHFKLRARIVFATIADGGAGEIIASTRIQHQLRRTICKGWRNPHWHGRMMAFLKLVSGDSGTIDLPLSQTERIRLDSAPITHQAPFSVPDPDTSTVED